MRQRRVVDPDETLALSAARAGHEPKLAMVYSIVLATALGCRSVIWTQDRHFASMTGLRHVRADGQG